MTRVDWYDSPAKPSWTPAPSTISPVWATLYPIILVRFGLILVHAFRRKVGRKVAPPFAINLVANLLSVPVFAGLRDVPVACLDILLVWATIIRHLAVAWPVYQWVAVAQVPSPARVAIATALPLSFTVMKGGPDLPAAAL